MISGVNMKQLALAAAAGALISMTAALANEEPAAPVAPAKPVEQTVAPCFACHGKNGKSENPQYPSLAGQYRDYLENALKSYKSGARKNPIMAGMAAGLSEQDIKQVAAFFAAQPDSPLYTPSLK